MKQDYLLHHPYVAGTGLAFVSLSTGIAALLAADFGQSIWVFAPLLLWLVTLGLPSTLAVLATASCWSTTFLPFYGLGPFTLVATCLAVVSQIGAVHAFNRLNRRGK